jgi:hypothetical protein
MICDATFKVCCNQATCLAEEEFEFDELEPRQQYSVPPTLLGSLIAVGWLVIDANEHYCPDHRELRLGGAGK